MARNEKGQEVNDQHINVNGRARLLSIGKFLPKEWGWVRVTRTKAEGKSVWLRIDELEVRIAP